MRELKAVLRLSWIYMVVGVCIVTIVTMVVSSPWAKYDLDLYSKICGWCDEHAYELKILKDRTVVVPVCNSQKSCLKCCEIYKELTGLSIQCEKVCPPKYYISNPLPMFLIFLGVIVGLALLFGYLEHRLYTSS